MRWLRKGGWGYTGTAKYVLWLHEDGDGNVSRTAWQNLPNISRKT